MRVLIDINVLISAAHGQNKKPRISSPQLKNNQSCHIKFITHLFSNRIILYNLSVYPQYDKYKLPYQSAYK